MKVSNQKSSAQQFTGLPLHFILIGWCFFTTVHELLGFFPSFSYNFTTAFTHPVPGRNKSYHPSTVTDWGLWFSQKMLETKRFSGKKINVLSSLLLRDCHFWISAKIFCIFFPESVLWFCESLMNSVIARKVPFIFEAFRCMFDSHSLIFSYWIDFWL